MTEQSSVPDNTEIFKQLEEYQWDKDPQFQVRTTNTSRIISWWLKMPRLSNVTEASPFKQYSGTS
jgi:hypothetical protein